MRGEARRGRVICYCRKEEDKEKQSYIVVAATWPQQQTNWHILFVAKRRFVFIVWGGWGTPHWVIFL